MNFPFPIIYDDPYIFAINKNAGIAACPGKNIKKGMSVMEKMQDFYYKEFGFKPYILHRLDFNTSGAMLFGKHKKDRQKLEGIFKTQGTRKIYLALVKGAPRKPSGIIDKPLLGRTVKKLVPAKTFYRILKKFGNSSLLEVTIETGRKHQIRKHLAMIGYPLVNDRQYGDFKFNRVFAKKHKFKKMFLHAWKIIFSHPFLQKNLVINAPYVLEPRKLQS